MVCRRGLVDISPIIVAVIACASLSAGHVLDASPRNAASDAAPYQPFVAPASGDAELARQRIQLADGLTSELFAAEPLLANPVAFSSDERGRVYVVETFRLHAGVPDIRGIMDWLDDDLACRSVADRLAMYRKRLSPEEFASWGVEHDRLRRLEDTDGDDKADKATVFADGFNSPETGLAAGVLAKNGQVWFTCIPDLWLLTDKDDDGQADQRQSLHTGYGVRVGFIGHDLHGLRFGPDGRLYFSIGDRGLHVVADGKVLHCPHSGAVVRCNPDGSEPEIFATGLRNPQELVFDQYGNLFTGENNSDGGDKARLAWLLEGGDSGWRIGYQFIEDPNSRGPWNAEKMWHPPHAGQPAYIVPPLMNLGDGPSGFCFYPGTGLPERYRDHFFLADFRGGSANSGVHSFALTPRGAGFEVTDLHPFAWSVLATDVDFTPLGGLLISDWVNGWGLTGMGRLYRVLAASPEDAPVMKEVRDRLAEGFSPEMLARQIAGYLAHPDQRLRQEAQFALAARTPPPVELLSNIAKRHKTQLARIHALWALGQIARRGTPALDVAVQLLDDSDPEIRAQCCRMLGDSPLAIGLDRLCQLVAADELRVRLFAALALGKLGQPSAGPALLDMLRQNADQDPYLRHAGVMALVWIADGPLLERAAQDESAAVRMAALLAWRRMGDEKIARFLDDPHPLVVSEAARAIYDAPIHHARQQLADITGRQYLPYDAARRALNANFVLGQPQSAQALADLAASSDSVDEIRIESLRRLTDWAAPSGRDPVVGMWRPLVERDANAAAAAVRSQLGPIFSGSEEVRRAATEACATLGVKEVGPTLAALAQNVNGGAQARAEALRALDRLEDERLAEIVEQALVDGAPVLRTAARDVLVRLDPRRAADVLALAVESGTLVEQQGALAAIGGLQHPRAADVLVQALDELLSGVLPPELTLEVLAAAGQRSEFAVQERLAQYEQSRNADDPLAPYQETMAGGNAERGGRVFYARSEVSCYRCHKIGEKGGEVGPDLSGIGAGKTRKYLLESIVVPSKDISKGYESAVVATDDGLVHVGVVKRDEGHVLTLMTAEGRSIDIPHGTIEERASSPSPMPEKLPTQLSKSDLRDLIEFLSVQRQPSPAEQP